MLKERKYEILAGSKRHHFWMYFYLKMQTVVHFDISNTIFETNK